MRSIQVENRNSYGHSSISSLGGYEFNNERGTTSGILPNGINTTKCSNKNMSHFQ